MAENQAIATLTQSLNTLKLEVKGISEKWQGKEAEMPPSDVQSLSTKLGQMDELQAKLNTFRQMEALNAGDAQPVAPPLAWRQTAPGEGDAPVDAKSWREVKALTIMGEQTIRYYVPLAVEKKNYAPAFEAYLRFGFDGVKSAYPNDFKTLIAGTDTAGGFLVPEDYLSTLIKKIAGLTAVRPAAQKITTSRDQVKMPRVNYTTDDKYTSGVRLTWTGENPASGSVHRVTDQVYGQITIPVHTAMASQLVSNQLIEDNAYDVMGHSSDLLAEAFALGEDDAFLNGNGVARPMGLLTEVSSSASGNGPVYVVSGTSADISTSGDAWSGKRLVDVYYALPAQYRGRAMWMFNSGTAKAVDNLVDAQKRPIVQTLMNASVGMGEPAVIKGRPIAIDEFVPDIAANAYPIIFGDFGGYMIVDRVGFSLQRLNERYAEEDLTLLIARKRTGGYCTEPYRFKVMKAGTS